MDVRQIVLETMRDVAREHGKSAAGFDAATPLLETGLDSLCLAVIVARLEDQLGTDPFRAGDDLAFPVTVGEFVSLYENALV